VEALAKVLEVEPIDILSESGHLALLNAPGDDKDSKLAMSIFSKLKPEEREVVMNMLKGLASKR
jgi:hypothetical protein